MFDKDLRKALEGRQINPPQRIEIRTTLPDISTLSESQLTSLHQQIEALLPPLSLSKTNLEREIMLQYRRASAAQADVLARADEFPANQVAQIITATSATLNRLVEMQSKHMTSERLKAIETSLIKALETIPPQYLTEFFQEYESIGAANDL